jgi:hypothetical protein
MRNNISSDKHQLHLLKNFLTTVGDSNEDTRYSTDQEPLVQLLINLCKDLGKTSIIEDFDQEYVHPMITIQKWNVELKEMVEEEIRKGLVK